MFMPQPVTDTRNPYYALTAALRWCTEHDIDVAYVPCMCTNFGGMTFEQSLPLMQDAVESVNTIDGKLVTIDDTYSVWTRHDDELARIRDQQPKIYMNMEFDVEMHLASDQTQHV